MPRKKSTKTSTSHVQKQISKAQALSFLLASIRDPQNPLHCGTCIDGAFIECTKDEREVFEENCWPYPTDIKAWKCDPAAWNAIVKFMFHKRTDEELQSLFDRMADCQCHVNGQNTNVERYHGIALENLRQGNYDLRLASNKIDAELSILTVAKCGWVFDVFISLSSAILGTRRKAAAKASANYWPASLTDLLPYGADSLIRSTLQWYNQLHDPVIFHFIAKVIWASQMLVVPSLIKYQFTNIVVQSTRKVLDRSMEDIFRLDLRDARTTRVSRCRFFWQTGCVISYFGAIKHEECQAALLRGCEAKIVQLYSIIIYMSEKWESVSGVKSKEEIDIEECTINGQLIFRLFHMHLSPLPAFPVHPSMVEDDVMVFLGHRAREPPEHGLTLTSIRKFRGDLRCSALGCSNSLSNAGRNFQRCGGCGVVSHCGRECQRNAWKREYYPHKRVCRALKNLIEIGGGYTLFFSGDMKIIAQPLNAPIFEKILENWKKANLDSDLSLVEDWARLFEESKGYPMPKGNEWAPGFEDYEAVIARLSGNGSGLKREHLHLFLFGICESPLTVVCMPRIAKYFNRTVRWHLDVERDRHLLKLQPFWGQEVT